MSTVKDRFENIKSLLSKIQEKEDGAPTVLRRAKQFSNRL